MGFSAFADFPMQRSTQCNAGDFLAEGHFLRQQDRARKLAAGGQAEFEAV